MRYLIFANKGAARAAEARISINIGCPIVATNGRTRRPDPLVQRVTHWAEIQEMANGRFCFMKPDAQYMTGVVGATEAEYDPAWFNSAI